MARKSKISPEQKLKAVKEYLNNEGSLSIISAKYGVSQTTFKKWVGKYKSNGENAFTDLGHTNHYSVAFKTQVVMSYLSEEGSFQDIAIKYSIPSPDTVRQWVLKYNGHKELKAYGTGGTPIMTKGRKTTYEERVDIVKYCIEHQNNYADTAQKYQVSYQQVYSWITKYEKSGIEGLLDNRGRRKPGSEMTEIERLRARNKILEAENIRKQMEIDFLKKLEEI